MTDEREYDRPAGWLILHDNYAFGPFPTKEAAEMVNEHTLCGCDRKVIPTHFPAGVVMSIDVAGLSEYFATHTLPGGDIIN